MPDYEPGPFTDTPRLTAPELLELPSFVGLADGLVGDLAAHHVTLDTAHAALTAQTTIDVDGALDGTHAALVDAARDAAAPVDVDDLNVAALAYVDVAGDLVNLESALPPEARQGPPPPFVPPAEPEPSEPPSPGEAPVL